MVRKLLLAVALCLAPTLASAACSGSFSASYFCGTGATGGAPGPQPYSAIFSTLPLPSADIFVGSAGGIATARAPSGTGDCTTTFTNLGVFTYTCTKTNSVAFAASATTDTTNASNISSGTLNTLRLPSPFTSGTRQGNTSAFVTYAGTTPTANHIATYDANGNIQDGGGSAGTVTTTGSPAAHQTAVFTGSTVIEGVSSGTTGQYFSSQGATVDPVMQSGPWTLLATLTASGSASLSDTTHVTSAYNDYEIVFENLLPGTNATTCEIQIQSSGSFQGSGYFTATVIGNNGAVASQSPTTFISCGGTGSGANSGLGVSGIATFFNPSVSGFHGFNVQTIQSSGAIANTVITLQAGGYWPTANVMTGFQIIPSSGVWTSGTVKLYGRL